MTTADDNRPPSLSFSETVAPTTVRILFEAAMVTGRLTNRFEEAAEDARYAGDDLDIVRRSLPTLATASPFIVMGALAARAQTSELFNVETIDLLVNPFTAEAVQANFARGKRFGEAIPELAENMEELMDGKAATEKMLLVNFGDLNVEVQVALLWAEPPEFLRVLRTARMVDFAKLELPAAGIAEIYKSDWKLGPAASDRDNERLERAVRSGSASLEGGLSLKTAYWPGSGRNSPADHFGLN